MNIDKTESKISLHGLGFLQVKMPANKRLHVWHPSLPCRRCYYASSIHNHPFGFNSLVLVGVQTNVLWNVIENLEGKYKGYQHEGPRTKFGNRPWVHHKNYQIQFGHEQNVKAGETYTMAPYMFHSTIPRGNGIVVTLMTKTSEGSTGATSLCRYDTEPDVNFDRFQMSEEDMWNIVIEALQHG